MKKRSKKPDPHSVRAFVLNYLQYGPANLDELYGDAEFPFGYSREEVAAAMDSLGVTSKRRPNDGAVFVMRPHNLVAIWWSQRAPAHRFTGTGTVSGGGSAA
jgi:hypothetical protein